MSKLQDALSKYFSSKLDSLAISDDGVVISFVNKTKIATIRVSAKSGQGLVTYTLDWPKDPQGAYLPDPEPYSTHVTLVYTNGNPELPRIVSVYDPQNSTQTRESVKRDIATYPTKSSRQFVGKNSF